ncbi:MAG TPA: hypothetical protein VHG08_05850, partial [Longimicrobium sp.]|nr:hypothetical protein [Longimicrobium sp.]
NGPGLHAPGRGRGAGVGLRNIRSRLRHLYGPAGSLELRPADGGGLEAVVSLPFRTAPAQPAASPSGSVDETGD